MPQRCRNRHGCASVDPPRRAGSLAGAVLVLHDHHGADGDPVIKIGHIFIGHAEAAGRHRLSDRLRLVGAVNAIERRAQIERAGAERVFDAAGHVARQVAPP